MDNIRAICFFKKQEELKPAKQRDKNLLRLLEADLNYKLRKSESNITNNQFVMNKEIKIFIASQSILTKERDFIENLIRHKNDEFIKEGIYLTPIRWEHSDKGISIDRKQNEFNQSLLDSEYVIYLTWDNIGHYTKEEFTIGYDSMKKGAKPNRIYVLNKAIARRMTELFEIEGAKDYVELKNQLWKDEKIIIDYEDDTKLKDEINHLFNHIKDNY